MTKICKLVAAAGLAAGLTVSTPSAQSQDHRDHQQHALAAKGQDVTLTSCVDKGLKGDTFILTHVADVPVHPATLGRVVYWLDTVKDVKKHVGRQIRIIGKVDDVEQREMEVKSGEDEGDGWYVEIEGPGRDVRTPAANVGVSAAGRRDEANDIKTTLVKLKVKEVRRVADACPQ